MQLIRPARHAGPSDAPGAAAGKMPPAGSGTKASFAEWVCDAIEQLCPPSGRSLDIGCGWQRYRGAFRNQVVGCDLRPEVLPQVAAAAEALPFPDDTFDFVTSFQCLYYSPSAALTAREVVRVLRPGGTALVSISGLGHLWWERLIGRLSVDVHGMRWWARRFGDAGARASVHAMSPRYSGWRGLASALQPQLLSAYRFLRVDVPGTPPD